MLKHVVTTGQTPASFAFVMKPGTKDQVEGKFHKVKGKIKEKVGQTAHSPNLQNEGASEKIAGKIQKKIGQIEKILED